MPILSESGSKLIILSAIISEWVWADLSIELIFVPPVLIMSIKLLVAKVIISTPSPLLISAFPVTFVGNVMISLPAPLTTLPALSPSNIVSSWLVVDKSISFKFSKV